MGFLNAVKSIFSPKINKSDYQTHENTALGGPAGGQKSLGGLYPYVQHVLGGYGPYGLYVNPSFAYWLWSKSDTIGDVVKRICWPFEQIDPVLFDKKTKEIINDHPFLDKLKNPGPMMSGSRFKYSLMQSFLLTGECYPVAIGNVSFEPVALYSIGANRTSLIEGADGWLQSIQFSANEDQHTYSRQILKNRNSWIYQRRDMLGETIQILIEKRADGLRAQSDLDRIVYQASTKYYGHIHNSAIVKNGARPSGMLSPKQPLTQEQYNSFLNEVREFFSGPYNAGRPMTPPTPIDYQDFLLNTRDMDFVQLIEQSRLDIYNQYQIPLPLVISDTMTLNNYQKANEALFDFSVLPRAKFLYRELGNFLLPRYKDGDRFELIIDEKGIPALKERLFARAEKMNKVETFSDNEIRTETGYESLGPEGDVIWKSSTKVPSNLTDEYTEDLIIRDDGNEEEEDNETD